MSQVTALFNGHMVQGVVPAADAFAGGTNTDVVSLAGYGRVRFIIITGAIEDAGISNLCKVQGCSNTTPSATTDMTFYYQSLQWSTSADTWGAMALAPATGYNFMSNNAVANCIHIAEVTADMVKAQTGYDFVRMNIAETANKTITACVLIELLDARQPQAIPQTAIA